ncbi:MAG: glycerol kinase, partial [Gammaproteobacteria bacterium]|nr:glycerol kinase [Gammaproteobacteria bacterium]
PVVIETTALGAAYLAGLQHGIFSSTDEIASHWREAHRFGPDMDPDRRDALVAGWDDAIGRVKAR